MKSVIGAQSCPSNQQKKNPRPEGPGREEEIPCGTLEETTVRIVANSRMFLVAVSGDQNALGSVVVPLSGEVGLGGQALRQGPRDLLTLFARGNLEGLLPH